jgi:hypothetical protein
MTTKPLPRLRDPIALAKLIGDIATGQVEDGRDDGKDEAAVSMGKKDGAEAKAAPKGAGDTWTWTAIDPDSKLVPVWYVGDRTADSCWVFLLDLKRRLRYADFQLTSDAFGS